MCNSYWDLIAPTAVYIVALNEQDKSSHVLYLKLRVVVSILHFIVVFLCCSNLASD